MLGKHDDDEPDVAEGAEEKTLPLPEDPADPLGLLGSVERIVEVVEQVGEVSGGEAGSSGNGADWEGPARYRVTADRKIRLADIDSDESGNYHSKHDAKGETKDLLRQLAELQVRLYAESRQSLLIVLQAMDAGGKDGAIRKVFSGVNPQGCRVWSFKVPTAEELAHDFLWRCHNVCPARGMITIFNRSYYEDVLVARVHKLVPRDVWSRRYDIINDFERMLALNNTVVLKFFLYISKDEQKERFQARLDNPDKNWKFAATDLPERARWDSYMKAYEDAINRCSTDYAPWYVVPANKKWYRNLALARTIVDTLTAMDPQYPPPAPGLDKVKIP